MSAPSVADPILPELEAALPSPGLIGGASRGGRWRAIGLVLAAAVVSDAIEAAFGSMAGTGGVPATRWLDNFRIDLPSWLIAAAMVPAVLWLAGRFRFRSPGLATSIAVHLLGTFAFVAVHVLLSVTAIHVLTGRPPRILPMTLNLIRLYGMSEMLIYATIVGVWNGVLYHREALGRARDTAELRHRLDQARLEALRLQLQPHFLFNTLQAITLLARSNETETLVRTVNNLGDLLRSVLDDGLSHDVSVEDELAFLGKYLDIQHVRFRDRLTVRWSIEDECRRARIPPLILQPLVENAMVHGIDARPGPGTVTIGARREGDTLVLSVEDSGPGFAGSGPARRAGVGLANTRARLELRWGDRMRFEGSNGPSGGARFEIRVPFESHESHKSLESHEPDEPADGTENSE